jgi:hypothetical protein
VSLEVSPPARGVSPVRVALVALGLIPLGAVAGAVAGALGVTIWLSIIEGVRAAFDPSVWGVAAWSVAPLARCSCPWPALLCSDTCHWGARSPRLSSQLR